CLTVAAYTKWIGDVPSGLSFLPSVIGILVSGICMSEDSTVAAAALAFRTFVMICWVEEIIVEGSIEGSVAHIQGVCYYPTFWSNKFIWTRACSLEDQQHHHIDKDGYIGSTSPTADKRVATLDEIMAALTRSKLPGDCAEDVEPGNRPSPIEIIGNVHKRQKELVMRSHLLLARSQLQGEFTIGIYKNEKLVSSMYNLLRLHSRKLEKEKSKQLEKDHLELKENHLKLQKDHVSLAKKILFLYRDENDTEDYEEAQDDI
ncbi:hypothetical protein Tco_1265619, partial [Tanacetum coccineum]